MFDTIGGIPLHPLIVHAVVVLVPLASLLLLLAAVSPRIRHWAGILTPITATLALVMVPLATQSGEALEKRVEASPTLEEHTELGDSLLYFVLVARDPRVGAVVPRPARPGRGRHRLRRPTARTPRRRPLARPC